MLAETKGKSYSMHVKFIDGKNARFLIYYFFNFFSIKKDKGGICLKTEFALNWEGKVQFNHEFLEWHLKLVSCSFLDMCSSRRNCLFKLLCFSQNNSRAPEEIEVLQVV